MAALCANAYYRENQITTVRPGQLLLLVYDGALRFLAEGKSALREKRYEDKNTILLRVQDLLTELIITLDHSVSPEIAQNLDRVYRYMFDRITTANIADDEQALIEVAGMLSELREAWQEADRIVVSAEKVN